MMVGVVDELDGGGVGQLGDDVGGRALDVPARAGDRGDGVAAAGGLGDGGRSGGAASSDDGDPHGFS